MNLFRLSKYAIQRSGGVAAMLAKAFRLVRSEGWNGFYRGVTLAASYGNSDYTGWVRQFDTLSAVDCAAIKASIKCSDYPPEISILLPVTLDSDAHLRSAVESVLSQLYPHWQLCIAADGTVSPSSKAYLSALKSSASQVEVIIIDKPTAKAELYNLALTSATGSWVVLNTDCCIFSDAALYDITTTIRKQPRSMLIYADEDQLDTSGFRRAPWFKCAWNPDLFLSQQYLGPLLALPRNMLLSVGGLTRKNELAEACELDLVLRLIEEAPSGLICHIPRVLSHRQRLPHASTVSQIASTLALNAHFQRKGIDAQATPTEHGFHIKYPLPAPTPPVTLIIPTRDRHKLLRNCIESLLTKTTYENFEIIVVDNGSREAESLRYLSELAQHPRVSVLRDDSPFNYSALNNLAVKSAKGEIIALVNNDIEVISPDWLHEMVSHSVRPEIGAVGAKLLYPNGSVQHAGIILGVGQCAGHGHKHQPGWSEGYFGRAQLASNYSAVTGACLVVRKSLYEEVGGLNQSQLTVAFNDVDFCLKLKTRGYRNLWTPHALLYHHESATRDGDIKPQDKQRFAAEQDYMLKTWSEDIKDDPCYSPNLSLEHENFSLAFPPRVAPRINN